MSNAKHNHLRVQISVLIIIACLLLTGCSDSLLGKWAGQGWALEFLKDNSVVITDPYGVSISGTYTKIENSRLKVEMQGFWSLMGTQVWKYNLSGNDLTIENESGELNLNLALKKSK